LVIPVDKDTRAVDLSVLNEKVSQQQKEGFRYFIVIINLATTMFGSVDDVDAITQTLDGLSVSYKVHVDGAFGGFIYPFTQANNRHSFKNPRVSSITIDAHKMLQAPYGTGIFLIRKNMMAYVCTEEASYVQGKDYTLCGSRSGANAVCVWMILHMHGAMGWKVKMNHLLDKTNSLCASLKNLGVEFFRHPALNIVTIKSAYVSPELASTFCLIPDNHEAPQWYKIVLMPHVKSGVLDEFLDQLQKELTLNKVSL
jgi:glutamate/tyrosine decarboxylase-like PLP-dependent enzyme